MPIRELNQRTAEVIARVESGERAEVTRNGSRVASIDPADPSPLGALLESGELRPARGRLPTSSGVVETTPDADGLQAVIEDRWSDGRW